MAELQLPGDAGGVERRLDGIEKEIREMRGFLERLVRVEERREADAREISDLRKQVMQQALDAATLRMSAVTLRTDLDALRITAAELRDDLDAVRDSSRRSAWSLGGIERLFWLLATAVAGLAAGWFGGGSRNG